MDAGTEAGIRGTLRSPARSQNVTYADAALLARHFGASYAAAVWRLRGLNLVSADQTQTLLGQTEEANRYLWAVRAFADVDDAEDEAPVEEPAPDSMRGYRDHELHGQVLSLALEAWWRGEISRGKLLEVGRLLGIGDDTILDLAD